MWKSDQEVIDSNPDTLAATEALALNYWYERLEG